MPEKFDLLGEISVLDANLLLNWLDMVTLERDEAQLVVNHIIDRLLAINGDVDSKVVRNLAAALWRAESILRFS